MVKSIKFLTLTFLMAFSFSLTSKAEIRLISGSANGLGDQTIPFTEGLMELPPGPPGSFELAVCATSSLGSNTLLDPLPDTLDILNAGSCELSQIGTCVTGIWAQNTVSEDGRDGLCRWTDPATVYAAGVFRWIGVDPNDPIIDIECNTGAGQIATSPSINVDEGSAIARVFTFGVNFNNQSMTANELFNGSIYVLSLSDNPGNLQGVFLREYASIAEETGPTEELEVNLATEIGQPEAQAPWRACTIGLRADTRVTPIPTMSEWGMGVFVILTAAASIWAIRRRTRTA